MDRRELRKRIASQTKPYTFNMTGVGGRPLAQLAKSFKAMGDEPVKPINAKSFKYDGKVYREDGTGSVEIVDPGAAFRATRSGRMTAFEAGYDKIKWS